MSSEHIEQSLAGRLQEMQRRYDEINHLQGSPEVLADPRQHSRIDGSGSVGSVISAPELAKKNVSIAPGANSLSREASGLRRSWV